MAYDFEEQEKLIQLKEWWNHYGNLVIATIVLGALVFAGVYHWRQHKATQAEHAGALYSEILEAAEKRDMKKVGELTGGLIEEYPRTLYASMGALVSAKSHVDGGDLKTAQAHLQWISDKSRDQSIQALARLRLAQVLLDQKAFDEALAALEAKHPGAFDAQFVEARGDIYLAQGKKAEARTAYEEAMKLLPESEKTGRDLLQFKIDALGAA
jgi:predicted negative regulator of RcsB-dependent stress response